MKTNFNPRDVMLCKVEYTLEDFWRDLLERVSEIYSTFPKEKVEAFRHLIYQILYFTFNEKTPQDIEKQFGLPEGIVEAVLACHKDDFEMLKSVIMGMSLRNMQEVSGVMDDDQNIVLLNAQLRNFHKKYNL